VHNKQQTTKTKQKTGNKQTKTNKQHAHTSNGIAKLAQENPISFVLDGSFSYFGLCACQPTQQQTQENRKSHLLSVCIGTVAME
jgi:hypothetical protein